MKKSSNEIAENSLKILNVEIHILEKQVKENNAYLKAMQEKFNKDEEHLMLMKELRLELDHLFPNPDRVLPPTPKHE